MNRRAMRSNRFSIVLAVLLASLAYPAVNASGESICSQVTLHTFESSSGLPALLCVPDGSGPFPAIVDLQPRICEGYAALGPPWEQAELPARGYVLLEIDSFAARGLAPGKCEDLNVLGSRQVIGDAYAGLKFLAQDSRVDRRRVGVLGFLGGIATAAIFATTREARRTFLPDDSPAFRAAFAFYPYCNLEFTGASPNFDAPIRIFIGEKDDMEPANRCVELAQSLHAHGANMETIVYPGAEAGFDITPPDTNYPLPDRTSLHPGGMTVSTHPQYSPWGYNFAACTIRLKSIFDLVDPAEVAGCMRRGVHFQGNAASAEQARADLKDQMKLLMGE